MNNAAGLTPLLIDAKKEYVGQLTDVLTPYVINTVQGLYTAAVAQRSGAPTAAFQRALRDIPTWNSTIISGHARDIENRFPFLGDLVAACFVAYVKILSSVKLHQQKPNIRLKLPSNETFVHKVYVHVAREFYSTPALVRADRGAKVAVVRAAVEASIRDMLPIEDILKAYLGNTVDDTDRTMNPGQLAEDDVVAEGELADDMAPEANDADTEFEYSNNSNNTPYTPPAQPTEPEFQQLASLQPQMQPQLQMPQPQMPQPQMPQPQMPQPQMSQPQMPQMPQPQMPQPQPQPQTQTQDETDEANEANEAKKIQVGQQPAAAPVQQDLFSDAEDEF